MNRKLTGTHRPTHTLGTKRYNEKKTKIEPDDNALDRGAKNCKLTSRRESRLRLLSNSKIAKSSRLGYNYLKLRLPINVLKLKSKHQMPSRVTSIGQGWTNVRGLRGLGGPKPEIT